MDDFDKEIILNKCNSFKSKKKQIEYLIKTRIDYQQKLSEEGEPSIFCDAFADTATHQGGGDDPLIIWLFNETERRRATLQNRITNPEWNITKIEEMDPNTPYPRRVIAMIKGVPLRTVENWVLVGVISADGERIYLKDTPKKNAKPILWQDLLDFENKRYKPTE